MISKKTNVKLLRRQALSYAKQDLKDTCSEQHQQPNAATKEIAPSTDATDPHGSSEERFKSILVDFAYLADPERYDSHLHILQGEESDEDRRKLIIQQEHLERKFIAEFGTTLGKFHDIFSEVLAYYHDINHFGNQLQAGHYVQYSVESLLQQRQGRQYLCELLYLYGSILILLDLYIPGTIRERLIIANHRYCSNINKSNTSAPTAAVTNFEQLCKLFQRTDESTSNQKEGLPFVPEHYYFTRMPLLSSLTEPVIECLMVHNIYPVKDVSYPSYHHRSTKLANQASMIFVILYLQPNVFKQEDKMRQLVDRFFADNWMIPLYNGEIVDLFIEWRERFPSAKVALESVLTESKIQSINTENAIQMKLWTTELNLCVNQTIITDLYVIENMNKLNDCIRNGNVALRWRILHRPSKVLFPIRKTSASPARLMPTVDDREIVNLFLLVSGLEANVKEAYERIIVNKQIMWAEFKKNAVARMQQLSNHFHGNDDLADEKNEEIGAWFGKMSGEIDDLIFEQSCQDVQLCIDSLNDIKMLDVIDRNAQVKKIIMQTEVELLRIVKCERISDDSCSILDNITECGYARIAMEYYVPIFHSGVTADPKSVGMLRSSFIKMASFLQKISTPTQHHPHSGTTFAMEYHSNAMLSFVKEILDVIPISIFSTYAMIVDSNEKSLSRLPTKIDADTLADHSLFDERYKLAKLTYELSILTEGEACFSNHAY